MMSKSRDRISRYWDQHLQIGCRKILARDFEVMVLRYLDPISRTWYLTASSWILWWHFDISRKYLDTWICKLFILIIKPCPKINNTHIYMLGLFWIWYWIRLRYNVEWSWFSVFPVITIIFTDIWSGILLYKQFVDDTPL